MRNEENLLNTGFTFDNFVVGFSNRLAFSAAKGVAESPGMIYNPLFIYSDVGLGKTHLLSAIGNHVKTVSPDATVVYLPSETFVSVIMKHLEGGTMEKFNEDYGDIDVLLLDDVQFLMGQEQTQDELIRIFDWFQSRMKQIAFTSDRPPKDMETLTDRLRSRFQGGLIVDIQSPDYETRLAILKHKAEEMNKFIPENVLNEIAVYMKENIREMIGALNKVIMQASIEEGEITLDIARQALSEFLPVSPEAETEIKSMDEFQKDLESEFADFISGVEEKVYELALTAEERKKREQLFNKIKYWDNSGYDTSRLQDIWDDEEVETEVLEEEFNKFEKDVNVLEAIQDELENLDTTGFQFEEKRLKALLFNPEEVEKAKRELDKLKFKIVQKTRGEDAPLTDYKFDDFIAGENNKMVYKAARMVAEKPGEKYNPLFVHGGVGLGKTHLMNSVGNYILETDPMKRVVYITAEKFATQLIESISGRNTDDFREKYRAVDVLLIDDIQFMAGKERTQEEFFHIFNELYSNHKAIIISSDRSPKELTTLEDRLRSRFEGGLVIEMKTPELETREEIVLNVLKKEEFVLPDEQVVMIAKAVKSNIRELNGLVNRLVAYCTLNDVKPSAEIVSRIIDENISQPQEAGPAETVDVESLIEEASKFWDLNDVKLDEALLTDIDRMVASLE